MEAGYSICTGHYGCQVFDRWVEGREVAVDAVVVDWVLLGGHIELIFVVLRILGGLHDNIILQRYVFFLNLIVRLYLGMNKVQPKRGFLCRVVHLEHARINIGVYMNNKWRRNLLLRLAASIEN